MTRVAWIGTGVMGGPMACHVKKAGYEVYAYNRSAEKALALKEQGIIPCGSIAEAAFVGNLSSGVTVRQIGRTGTASRQAMLSLFDEQFGG